MKRVLILIIALIISAAAAYADEPLQLEKNRYYFSWDEQNTKLHKPLTALFLIDAYMTAKYVGEGDHQERNPLLGSDPSTEEIYAYFAGAYLATTGITSALHKWVSPRWSYLFQKSVITIETFAVGYNIAIGLNFHF